MVREIMISFPFLPFLVIDYSGYLFLYWASLSSLFVVVSSIAIESELASDIAVTSIPMYALESS